MVVEYCGVEYGYYQLCHQLRCIKRRFNFTQFHPVLIDHVTLVSKFQFVSLSKRLVPEAINFLSGVLFLAASKPSEKGWNYLLILF